MKSRLAIAVLMLALFAGASPARGQQSGYLLLHSPSGHHGRWASPGQGYHVSRPSYAWGWFGASRHTNSYYHSGYYGAYWQRTDR